MKKILKILSILSILASYGCSTEGTYDYSLYYSYRGNMKGIEVYCWNKKGSWYSGILLGTNMAKLPKDVIWLQENLPCPLNTMKDILATYPQGEIGLICIVDLPATKLIYRITDEKKGDYEYVCEQMGIPFPNGQFY